MRVSQGEELDSRLVDRSAHREREQCCYVVQPELVGLREERGSREIRDRVCAGHFGGDIVVSLSFAALCCEQGWVRGPRGVRRL